MSDSTLRRALGYRRFQGPPRLLLLDTGYHVLADVLRAARTLGWEVCALPTKHQGQGEQAQVARLLTALVQHRPDFVFTVNHLGFDTEGVLAELLWRYEIPLCSWFVDHPLPILGTTGSNVSPGCQIFCIERTALPWLRAQGFRDPEHLPTATGHRPEQVDRARAAALGAPLCLVGDSWWRKGLGENPELVAAAEALRRRHCVDRAFAREEMYTLPLEGPGPRVLQVALAQAACDGRRDLGRALQPLGLTVYGDPHWTGLVPGLELRPPTDPRSATPAVYAGSAVNVNVTAPQLPTGVTQRVWDVPGAGGFLLTDGQEDALQHLREGGEMAVYRSLGEAAELARFYLDRPALRQAMAARAAARVAQAHRYEHRLTRIYQVMRARFA